ncbi:hypothetical protein K4K57_011416 [Colletotrichum sp. SAR 10_99]|nr:hypothetical protein K4K57_011416 [Colletotrichum sp. SAR 10_99]
MPQAHTFTEIPRIDLSLASDPATEPVLLDQLRDALINVGFLYVINHGVPQTTISNVVEALPTLFALPVKAKDEIALRNSPHFLGYSGDGSETTAGKSDRREQVEFATELENVWREGVPLRERLRGPNQGYHRARLEAKALGLTKTLQALNKNGDWIDVPVLPGSFVVNIGQAFEVVTNGVCKATTHRVLSGSLERFSVPFFQGVRRDLTKEEAVGTLRAHFEKPEIRGLSLESEEGRKIDSAFLKGKYDTWGENQLRTKIRSHRDVGQKFYADVFDKYVNDDQ